MSYTCEQIIPALASVTEHLVHEVAHSDPEQFIVDNKISVYKVLSYLGMDVCVAKGDGEGYYNGGVRYEPDQIVRNTLKPHMTYRCGVYRGLVKKVVTGTRVVDKRDEEGNVVGTQSKPILAYHKMADIYDKYGTLQAQDIYKYVKEEDMVNILDEYREGV